MPQNISQEESATNEISLMDLIRIVLKYKKTFIRTALIVMLGSLFLGYYLLKPHQLVIQPIYMGYFLKDNVDKIYFEENTDIVAQLQAFIVPKIEQTQYQMADSKKYTYDTTVNGVVYLKYPIASAQEKSMVLSMNKTIIEELKSYELPRLKVMKDNLEARRTALLQLQKGNGRAFFLQSDQLLDKGAAVFFAQLELIKEQQQEASLTAIAPGEPLVQNTAQSTNWLTILFLSIFIGFFLAFMLVLIINFITVIRKELK